MGRPKQDPVKEAARRILALTIEQRNALDVALQIYEEAMSGGAKTPRATPAPRRKPKPTPPPEAANG